MDFPNFNHADSKDESISFHFLVKPIPFILNNKDHLSKWINDTAQYFKFNIGMINFILSDDEYLQDINWTHLQHEEFTDIITFQYDTDPIAADIYISNDRVVDNAKQYEVEYEEELLRIVIHGILHCCGLTDKTEKDKTEMRHKEDFFINTYKSKYVHL